ncbi:MAG: protein kinase [Acidobacteriota bacterium]
MSVSGNPYLSRVMIRNPLDFFGRRRELQRIFSRIGAERPQSVSIVGERRIGKSSLLYHLSCPEIRQRYLGEKTSLRMVFLDFQQLRDMGIAGFFQHLFEKITLVDPEVKIAVPPGYRAFQRILEDFQKEEKGLVLLLDEFDAVTSNPVFTTEFYSFLRSAANHYPAAYVTTSQTELQRLCHSSEVSDSPFFNIFTNLHLRCFEREEALEMIARRSSEQGVPLIRFADEILELAGQFPLFLQIACCLYFDKCAESCEARPDPDEIREQFLEEAGPHFEYFWEHVSLETRVLLRRVLGGERPRPDELHLCRKLKREGYLIDRPDGLAIFSSAFGHHIATLESSATRRTLHTPLLSEPEDPLSSGTQVNQYRLLSRAGEGGMGVIYRAEDCALTRNVALKFIQPGCLRDETARKRFRSEARLAASLNHPAITSVYEYFEVDGQVVLVMEWIDGETLRQRIRDQGPVEWPVLTAWLMEVCDGLEAAHAQGIIHRDIKSSNLMITPSNHIKIMDFGLAKRWSDETLHTATSQLTEKGGLLGTLNYMSPEQIRGEALDCRSDLFSLGVVFFEALTGRLPFGRQTPAAQMQAILHEPQPHLALYQIEQAQRLDTIVRRLLEKRPRDRYLSAARLKEDLVNLSRGRKRVLTWLRGR